MRLWGNLLMVPWIVTRGFFPGGLAAAVSGMTEESVVWGVR